MKIRRRAGILYLPLEQVLKESDLISLHCPLTEETHHMINKQSIQTMKDGVILVNTSRGGLIKTVDLIEGIRAGKFFAVGLDVYEEESPYVFEDLSEQILQTYLQWQDYYHFQMLLSPPIKGF